MGCENCEARKAVTLRQKTTTTQMRKPKALLLLLALTLTACHGTRPDDTAQTLYERALEALAAASPPNEGREAAAGIIEATRQSGRSVMQSTLGAQAVVLESRTVL